MQNIYRGSKQLFKVSITLPRHLSTFTLRCNKWNPVAHQRHCDLGRHVYEAFTIRTLIDQHPQWTAGQIHDVTQGLATSDLVFKNFNSLDASKSISSSQELFAKLGELRLRDEEDSLDELLQELNMTCLLALTDKDKDILTKIQHPKFILKEICTSRNGSVSVSITKLSINNYEAVVTYENDEVSKMSGESHEEAERLACIAALQGAFANEFDIYLLDSNEIPPEESINLELNSKEQRQVILEKSSEESFGFSIRGGERKVIRNKEYIQLNTITPVFISLVEEDSPASRCGLQVGDVLLAVNDHSMVESTHGQAVTSLKKFVNRDEVLFTVRHSHKEVRKYEVQQKYLEREKEKIREEISSKNFGKWHDAKAKIDPEQYFLEQVKEKKRPFQAKKHRQSLRLWDH